MERGRNNGVRPFRSARIFGVDFTVPYNGDSLRNHPHQPLTHQNASIHVRPPPLVESLTVTDFPNQTGDSRFDLYGPNISRNPAFYSSTGGQTSSNLVVPGQVLPPGSRNVYGGATGMMVVEEPRAAHVPFSFEDRPPYIDFLGIGDINSMQHYQPAVAAVSSPPPHAPNVYAHQPNIDATYPIIHVANMDMHLEATVEVLGQNLDHHVLELLIELLEEMVEILQGRVDDGVMDLSTEIEEIVELLSPQQHTGLSEEVIMSRLGASKYQTSSEHEESCCICMDEFSTGDALGKINCEHKFHFMCIMEWLKRNNVCPICRALALSVN